MTGLLLCNLGTPDEPTPGAVRRYLREFLSDPRVLDMSALGRWLLLHAIILPLRSSKSAAAYRKIWTRRGSPLLWHSEDLVAALRERLGPDWMVELGMRYQKPSLAAALDRLCAAGVERIVVLPLYPQLAASSTGSTLAEVMRLASKRWSPPLLSMVGPFFDDPGFVAAFAAQGAPVLEREKPDVVLFSFHGLPERQVRKSDRSGTHCLSSASCCSSMGPINRDCYRAQCFATAAAIAGRLALPAALWRVSFQSRLGRTRWIEPYTDVVIGQLAAEGKKRLLVFCPAFVADCLETLEEIALRGRDIFLAASGEHFAYLPCLNAEDEAIKLYEGLVRRELSGWFGQAPKSNVGERQ